MTECEILSMKIHRTLPAANFPEGFFRSGITLLNTEEEMIEYIQVKNSTNKTEKGDDIH